MAHGGQFSENTGAKTKSESGITKQSGNENVPSATESSGKLQSATSVLGASGGQGGAAPTYIASQYIKDKSGPHGKNLKEGIDYEGTEDGLQKALNAEPGSEDDPARLAERQFQQTQLRAAGGTGPKQQHAGGETMYENLKSNEQA
ncbi:hypothetical protein SODALDRAFT_69958 [Sodiomyces alkalinus F11]|uniref:Uncharacterized protein n=1 Tax=Sodiomyces alkalinus (strain CBS 110278 / VKM F-3762 / F11) TaxID=1314773 RepID=A0A3N2PM14_SODAK|nr:hypothetical protein SODALDRAFT_69958 [Sodiomyces alkalinus F11]ROT35571.1 hypothetical protein SODALDRAFT_69958 [Sodiomyces alkalinus F11]